MENRQLPEGWEMKKLYELCEIYRGGSPRPIKDFLTNEPNGINWIKISDASVSSKYIYETKEKIKQDGVKYSRLVNEGDFILSNSMSFGRPYIMRTSGCIHDGWLVLKDKSGLFDQNYLYYFLGSNTTYQQFDKLAAGSTVRNLNIDLVKSVKVLLPPLPEQKRIVAILDEAFEGIDRVISNTEKNLSNARELFESYLNYKLFGVASNKPTQTLSCITNLIIDCEHKTAPTKETGIPSIRTPNIGKGYLIFDNVNRVSEEIYELWTRRGKPEPGDLILAREAPAGNVGVIPEGYKVCLGQRTVLIRPNKKIVDSEYLAFLLLHPLIQKRLLAKSTGATVQHVNMKDIRELAISELPPIQTQRDCIQDLKQLESQSNRLENIYRQKIAALKELKQSILQKAFTGELTVRLRSPTTADNGENEKEEIAA
ncbi:restriction endonuclease subunit S [Anabaenopsis sp. FSS-46]|uniref:restriction endonuclease subunit S n=1 Tax=Anabaenopsis sp. FSS-46 TaxID=2971766 RepID=UPI002474AD43|nr:restriction endonuclease subunit S [Anabaenopsis sp. FSS-46]MDH6100647.1 restriction endonuclease subunit S [Anabaenopsis sp. FSS-46]